MQETQEMWVQPLGWEDVLEEEKETCSSILIWKTQGQRSNGRLQSTELQSQAWLSIHAEAY